MKTVTVFLCVFLYCVNTVNSYRIFPLPGQTTGSNPKFGSFSQPTLRPVDQTTKFPEVNSRLGSFTSQTNRPEANIFGNFARNSSSIQAITPSTPESFKTVTSNLNKEGSTKLSETTNSGASTTFGNVGNPVSTTQAVVPTIPPTPAIKILNRPSGTHTAVEPPSKDLLPPKEDSNPTQGSVNAGAYKPTLTVPFNDLLPPKTV